MNVIYKKKYHITTFKFYSMYYSLYNVKNAITVIQKLKTYKIDNIL